MTPNAAAVLIHGVGLDSSLWDFVGPGIGTDRQVITYDLLGHGNAPPLADGSTLQTLVDQLESVVDSIFSAGGPTAAEGSVDVVGFSLGALVATAFAIRSPERVRRLVLVNSVYNRDAAQRASILERVGDVRAGNYLATVDGAIDRWFSAEFQRDNRDAVETIRAQMKTNDVHSYANAYEIFATADADLVESVATITAPTLVITGSCDERSTPEMTEALADRIPNGSASIIDAARHMTPIESPVPLIAAIREFLGAP